MFNQRRHADAEAAYRKAIDLKPDYAEAHYYLGELLNNCKRMPAEAETAFLKAIALKPDFAAAYYSLGGALYSQGKHADAETAWRKTIALKPNDVTAYNNLGAALNGQGKFAEAEAAYRKAIALKPDFAPAYSNLGALLNDHQGKHVEAEAAFRKAIALNPNDATAYNNLGTSLRCQGKFKESLAAYRRGHELGSKQPDKPHPSHQQVREAERMFELDKKLPAILQGEATFANAADTITLAWMCRQPYKKRYAASARLYAHAFATEPKLAADLQQLLRYHAACSAALAAAGQGEDARLLPDKVVAMFRAWALRWLRDDLMAYAKLAGQHDPNQNKAIQQRMAHWHSDPELASLRDPQALDRLPGNERATWHSLWRDVDQLAKRTAKQNKPTQGREAPQNPQAKP